MTSIHYSYRRTLKPRHCANPDCDVRLGAGQPYTRIVWLDRNFETRDFCTTCGSDVEDYNNPPFNFVDFDDFLATAFWKANDLRRIDAAVMAAEARADERREERRHD